MEISWNWSKQFIALQSQVLPTMTDLAIMTDLVKTLDQLTETLNREGFESKCSSVYPHLLHQNHRTTEGKSNLPLLSFANLKLQISKFHINQQSLPVHQSDRKKNQQQFWVLLKWRFIHKIKKLKSLLGWLLQASQHLCSCTWNIRSCCLIMILFWLLNTSWYPPSLVYEACLKQRSKEWCSHLLRCYIHWYQKCQAFSIICIRSFSRYDEDMLST